MSALLPGVVAVPVLAAAIVPFGADRVAVRRVGLLGVPVFVLVVAVALIVATRDGHVVVEHVAGWRAGIAIAFVADLFSALVLAVMALLVLVCSMFVIAAGDDDDPYVAPLILVLSGGVFGALLTADLFNLFVFIEVALIPSYVLISRQGTPGQLAAGRIYLAVNLMGSTVLLAGVALVYGVTGTVHLGELAGAGSVPGMAAVAGGVVLLALAVKAALVPVHGWLPRTYPWASPAVNALFSGLLTKIGVYALFRVYSVYFEGAQRMHGVVLAVTVATMVIGVMGALGEQRMRSILTFHMISQVGYIVLGLAFFGVLGMAAAIFYLLHHTIVKASLFLSAGAVERTYGTDRIERLGGLARREPWLAAAFMAAALSLAGLPPFSGFIAKFTLVRAAVIEQQYLAAAFAVVVSLFTLLSMLKIWSGAFLGVQESAEPDRVQARLLVPGVMLAGVTVVLGLSPEVLLHLVEQAARGLVDTGAYVRAVTGA